MGFSEHIDTILNWTKLNCKDERFWLMVSKKISTALLFLFSFFLSFFLSSFFFFLSPPPSLSFSLSPPLNRSVVVVFVVDPVLVVLPRYPSPCYNRAGWLGIKKVYSFLSSAVLTHCSTGTKRRSAAYSTYKYFLDQCTMWCVAKPRNTCELIHHVHSAYYTNHHC